jgi:hypothetical protein
VVPRTSSKERQPGNHIKEVGSWLMAVLAGETKLNWFSSLIGSRRELSDSRVGGRF